MKANAKSMASFNASQERARRRRNRSITLVLVGIIALFLVCHTGEVALSIYELADVLDGKRSAFPEWANHLLQVNHLLIVMNSSLNFVIYCKDMVFRFTGGFVIGTYFGLYLVKNYDIPIDLVPNPNQVFDFVQKWSEKYKKDKPDD